MAQVATRDWRGRLWRSVATMPMVTDRVRNHATYQALRRAKTHEEVREIFGAGLNQATGHQVHLEMDDQVNLHAAKQITMNALVLLRHYRENQLREVLISDPDAMGDLPTPATFDADQSPAFVVSDSKRVRERTGMTGDTLWFNSRIFGKDAGDTYVKSMTRDARERKVNPAWRLGIAALVAHEVGHLIGNVASRLRAAVGDKSSLTTEVMLNVHTPEAGRIRRQVAKEYKSEHDFYANAPDPAIRKRQRDELTKAGFPQDAVLNVPVAEFRSERIASLKSKFYAPTPTSELGKALVTQHQGQYAATDEPEMEGEGIMAVVIDGERADEVSKVTHAFDMRTVGRPENDRPKDYLKYNELIVLDNRAQRAAGANPWLNLGSGDRTLPNLRTAAAGPPIASTTGPAPDDHRKRQSSQNQSPPSPQQSLGPDGAPRPGRAAGAAPMSDPRPERGAATVLPPIAAAGVPPVRPGRETRAPRQPSGPVPEIPGRGRSVERTQPPGGRGAGRVEGTGRILPGPSDGKG